MKKNSSSGKNEELIGTQLATTNVPNSKAKKKSKKNQNQSEEQNENLAKSDLVKEDVLKLSDSVLEEVDLNQSDSVHITPVQIVQPIQTSKRNAMHHTEPPVINVNLTKQILNKDIDLDSLSSNSLSTSSSASTSPTTLTKTNASSSNISNNDYYGILDIDTENGNMLVPQSLDNSTTQKIVCSEVNSHIILDDNETLQVKSAQEFIQLFRRNLKNSGDSSLPVNEDKLVKCVSIFGNTGDGKSHTLNHTFFNGRNIFRTSNKQETCTMGVWCAYDALTNSLIFDTEGLLGTTSNENKRMRLLLKVLAISDVIIYRTRAERLHNDLFKFLSDASTAYLKYFSKELKQAAVKLKLDTISCLGPDCVIFHETQYTDILKDEIDSDGNDRTVAHQLRERFAKLDLSYNAFSSIEYVGTQTNLSNNNIMGKNFTATNFTELAQKIQLLLKINSVRPPRKLSSIYQVFKVLNDKFNGVINKYHINTFADEYFTCSASCLSCG